MDQLSNTSVTNDFISKAGLGLCSSETVAPVHLRNSIVTPELPGLMPFVTNSVDRVGKGRMELS